MGALFKELLRYSEILNPEYAKHVRVATWGVPRLKDSPVKQFNARTIKSTTAARTPELLRYFLFPFLRSLALICIWNVQATTAGGAEAGPGLRAEAGAKPSGKLERHFLKQGDPRAAQLMSNAYAIPRVCGFWFFSPALSAVNCQQKFCFQRRTCISLISPLASPWPLPSG